MRNENNNTNEGKTMTIELIAQFAELVQEQTIERLEAEGSGCQANLDNAVTRVRPGKKYTKVDLGTCGKYMVVNDTGEIFGIKSYGVIHRGHAFGTLDTVADWNWGGYRAVRRPEAAPSGSPGETLRQLPESDDDDPDPDPEPLPLVKTGAGAETLWRKLWSAKIARRYDSD